MAQCPRCGREAEVALKMFGVEVAACPCVPKHMAFIVGDTGEVRLNGEEILDPGQRPKLRLIPGGKT